MQHVKHSDDLVWGGKQRVPPFKSFTQRSASNTRVGGVFSYAGQGGRIGGIGGCITRAILYSTANIKWSQV